MIEDEKELKKRRLEKKRQLKMKFDLDYDGDDAGGKSHYEELKKEVDQQAMVSLICQHRIIYSNNASSNIIKGNWSLRVKALFNQHGQTVAL